MTQTFHEYLLKNINQLQVHKMEVVHKIDELKKQRALVRDELDAIYFNYPDRFKNIITRITNEIIFQEKFKHHISQKEKFARYTYNGNLTKMLYYNDKINAIWLENIEEYAEKSQDDVKVSITSVLLENTKDEVTEDANAGYLVMCDSAKSEFEKMKKWIAIVRSGGVFTVVPKNSVGV